MSSVRKVIISGAGNAGLAAALALRQRGVAVTASDGRAFEADVRVGADGVHSTQRRSVVGDGSPGFNGLMAWRAVVPTARLAPDLCAPVGVNWVGPGGHVIMLQLGSEPEGSTPEDFVRVIATEIPLWLGVARGNNIQPE